MGGGLVRWVVEMLRCVEGRLYRAATFNYAPGE